jgi:hypothetical protein
VRIEVGAMGKRMEFSSAVLRVVLWAETVVASKAERKD